MPQSVYVVFSACAVLIFCIKGFNAKPNNAQLAPLQQGVSSTGDINRLTLALKQCLNNDQNFRPIVINVAGVKKTLQQRFYEHDIDPFIIKMLKIAKLICEYDHEKVSEIEILIRIIEMLSRNDFGSCIDFLDNLLRVFEISPKTGCFLLVKAFDLLTSIKRNNEEKISLNRFIQNLILLVRLLSEKHIKFHDTEASTNLLIEIYNSCYVFADMTIKIVVRLVQYSGEASLGRIKAAIFLFLETVISMMDADLDDLLSEILEILLMISECFKVCQRNFLEMLEELLKNLKLILDTKCEDLFIEFIDAIQIMVCKCEYKSDLHESKPKKECCKDV